MAANTSISLVNLDFDTLKASLKTYLKDQSLFSDYDFDGSNMSVLLDILSYNSYLNAFYLNMVASEMFLDSAQLKNSVISIAKTLNYTPRSVKSAKALLNLSFDKSSLDAFEIPEGTRFSGKNSNGSFTFITNESVTLYPVNNKFEITDLEVYEGSLVQDTFIYNSAIEGQRFILSNDTIDIDSIVVMVSEDNGQTNQTYKKTTSLFGLNSNSAVYFIQATENTKYELVFGDGVFGKKPRNGALIIAAYRITSGTSGNKCTNFTLDDNLGSYNGHGSAIIPSITVSAAAFGGGEAETIEEIRYRAAKNYQTQERAVTTEDFKTLILQNYQTIKTAHVFGGETIENFPQYGKVFIAPATYTGEVLSDTEKIEIESFIANKCTIGITPVIVDPDYLYVLVDIVAKYNANDTELSPTDIATLIKNDIVTYNDDELNDFNVTFKFSRFETVVNDVHSSISSNETKIILKKILEPTLNKIVNMTILFRNKILPGSFYSSEFISGGRKYIFTDYNPNSNTFKVNQTTSGVIITNDSNTVYLKDVTVAGVYTYSNIGFIDYETGTITLNQLVITDLINEDGIYFYCKPDSNDVSSSKNDILLIDEAKGITISVKSI